MEIGWEGFFDGLSMLIATARRHEALLVRLVAAHEAGDVDACHDVAADAAELLKEEHGKEEG